MSEVANSLWVEKYRPQTLDDYVGNQQLKKTMEKYIEQDDIPSVLLYGKAGTGKTSLAKILVNSIDCDYIYINASDENNIETIRTKVKSFVSTVGFKKWKVVVLDESDALTNSAQAMLRNLTETFSKTARFILTCNYVEKIIDPIRSRCATFEVIPPSKMEVAQRLIQILESESVEYDKKDVGTIVNNNYPDIRRVISNTQRNVFNGKLELSEKEMAEVEYMESILQILMDKSDAKQKFKQIRQKIADSKIRQFDDLYIYLYDNVEKFSPDGAIAQNILDIAEAQRHDISVVDKEINAMAMIIKIISNIN